MPSPSSSSATSTFTLSSVNTIDALLNEDHQKWRVSSGSDVAKLTYSFPWFNNADATWQPDYSSKMEPEAATHFGFTAAQINAASAALQSWADVALVTFTQVSDAANSVGDFRFAFSSAVKDPWGWSYFPDSHAASAADVWINPTYATGSEWTAGSFNYYSLIHEAGHGLGLKHPGNYDASTDPSLIYLPATLDYRNYTVMSYNDWQTWFLNASNKYIAVVPDTPMVYDIAAIQYLYGANNSYQTGNNTYTFDPSLPFYKAIWDAGGIDSIDISNFSTDCTIDLRSGSYSSLHYLNKGTMKVLYDGSNNLGIAFGVTIENATGGSGNDTITGNSASNTLSGGKGNDTIDGGDGADLAVFSGNFADYTVNYNEASGIYTIADRRANGDGSDHVTGVEQFQFSDGMQANILVPTVTLFSPTDGAVNVGITDNIVITFSKAILKGSGTVAIHVDSPTGRVFEPAYNVSTSENVSVSDSKLTINPTAFFATSTHYYVTLDAGVVKDSTGNSFGGMQSYDFTTGADPYGGLQTDSSGGTGIVLAGVASLGLLVWVIL
jgi:hypothetical protein